MTDPDIDAANNAYNRIKPIFSGLNCRTVGHVLIFLCANWLLSIEADPPDPEETETMRADALEQLALETVRLVRENEELLRNPQ